jgi:beta-N-acetylhexosaminidase
VHRRRVLTMLAGGVAAGAALAAVSAPTLVPQRGRTSVSALTAFITGCSGLTLSSAEWQFLQDVRPCGLILFQRNCNNPAQVKALIESFKDAVGSSDLLILVDQEGGRVQRMKPPHWRSLPPASAFGALYKESPERGIRAAKAASQLVALELARNGFNVNCAPVLDVPIEGAHDVIGDRAYAADPAIVAALGRAVAEGLLSGGVLPVIKHLPGHGRATLDSHKGLPVIDVSLETLRATDFLPFKALADMPAALTAHVVLTAIDAKHPASCSPDVVRDIIRGEIGFDGLLMNDDIGMGALGGTIAQRADAVLDAGHDVVLHCSGILEEMRQVAGCVPYLENKAELRFKACLERLKASAAFDVSEALAALDAATAMHN